MANIVLSEIEREVLVLTRLTARAGIPELAKVTGRREHQLRYALKKLTDELKLCPHAIINPSALGLIDVGVYLTLSRATKSARDSLVKRLANSSSVPCVNRLIGPYQIFFSMIGRSLAEHQQNLNALIRGSEDFIIRQVAVPRVRWFSYPPKYLAPHLKCQTVVQLGGDVTPASVDDLDCRILNSLSNLADIQARGIARSIGIPESTVAFRLESLEKRGVLLGFGLHAMTDPSLLGVERYTLLVRQYGADPEMLTSLRTLCQRHPNVTSLVECLGEWSFEIGIETISDRQISEFEQLLYEQFQESIAEITTFRYPTLEKLAPFPGRY